MPVTALVLREVTAKPASLSMRSSRRSAMIVSAPLARPELVLPGIQALASTKARPPEARLGVAVVARFRPP
jgi:hypothetical protein